MNGYITKIFVLCMVLGAFGVGAAAAAPAVTISPASTTGLAPGDSFSVSISVNPDGAGVSSGDIRLSFDASVLEVTSLTKGDILGTNALDGGSSYDNTAGTVTTIYTRVGATTPPTAAGTWATVDFSVKTGAVDGATNIAITSADLADEVFFDLIGITTTDGTATVGAAAPAPAVTISPASTTGLAPGDSFSVSISVNPDGAGVSSGDIRLSFDASVLEVTSLTKGDILGTNALDGGSSYDNTAGTVTTIYTRVGATTPPTAAGTWATVDFSVKTGAVDGATNIAITSADLADEVFFDLIGITTTDGTATVGAAGAVTLTWTTEPPASVTQGDDVKFDVSFSELADYYFRIENSTGERVWRYPEDGTNPATNPTSKTWTTTPETLPGDYTIIVSIDGMDNADTRTVTVKAGTTPTLASITISSASDDLIAGTTQPFTATCMDANGAAMTCPTLTWSSSNVTVGTITAAGVFSALAEGTTTITASADGVTSNAAAVTVSPAIVQINSWALPAAGNLGTAIGATVTIENLGAGRWFVVSVAGTSTTGKSIVGLGTIELDAGEIKAVKVKIPVPGDAGAAGTYTLYPDVYTFDGYPDVNAIQATGSGEAIVIS